MSLVFERRAWIMNEHTVVRSQEGKALGSPGVLIGPHPNGRSKGVGMTIQTHNEGPTPGFDPETDRASAETDFVIRALQDYADLVDVTGQCSVFIYKTLMAQLAACREREIELRLSMNQKLEEKLLVG